MIFRLLPSSVTNQRHVEFSNTLHWVERESLKHELIDRGFKENSLTVIGNPMYDGILKKVHEIKSNYKKEGKIRVLLATTSLYEHGLWSKKQRDEEYDNYMQEEEQNDQAEHKADLQTCTRGAIQRPLPATNRRKF